MGKAKRIPPAIYKLLIVVATIIWGASFVFMKDAVGVMEPAWLIGVRFTITALILTAVFWRQVRRALTRRELVAGAVLGLANFMAYWVQTIGLAYTTPGKNAFLTAVYCVIVPFIYWAVAARRPTRYNLLAAALGVAGIGFVSLASESLTVGFGDAMSLLSAVFFALHIVLVGRNVLALTVYQFWMGGLCSLAAGALTEPVPDLAAITPDFVLNMVYLVVFASCIALVLQNVALAHVPPTQASLLLSLESVFGVVFSVLLYGEALTPRLLVGFALIFGAILISELLPRPPKAKAGAVVPQPAEGRGGAGRSVAAGPGARRSPEGAALADGQGAAVADLLQGDAMAAGELEQQMGERPPAAPPHEGGR